MPDPTPITGAIGPLQAEIAQVRTTCDDRHRRRNASDERIRHQVQEHQEKLIELAGRSGKNGQVGELRRDMDETAQIAQQNRLDLARIKLVAGASAGAGSAIGYALTKLAALIGG